MKKGIFLVLTSFFLISLTGCISTNRLTTLNYADFLSSGEESNPFRHTLMHENDSVTLLIVETDMNKLKYKKKEKSDQLIAKYQIGFQVYPDITSNSVSDSNSIYYEDSLYFAANRRQTHQIKIKLPSGHTNFVNIEMTDMQSGKSYNRFHEISKSSEDALNYLTKNASGSIHYPDYKRFYDSYRFSYRDNLKINLMAIHFDIENARIADPPFSDQSPPDSGFQTKDTIALKQGILNTQNRKGLFVIRSHDSNDGGKLFLTLNEDFPKPSNNNNFIAPLRYITTNQEFMKLRYATDKQLAKESFWQEATNDFDRAFKRMREYDRRVMLANRFFSHYKEGWKTDRGMIFIIFDKPDSILKYEGQEKWIYNKEHSRELTFIFKQQKISFPVSEYFLERKESYRIPWYKQVETWKN